MIIPVLAGVGLLSFIGILLVGADSARLAFTLFETKKSIAELTKTNESLTSEVASLRTPDLLWQRAAMLELVRPQEIKYLTFERDFVARLGPSFAP
jgi:hypothetical protein